MIVNALTLTFEYDKDSDDYSIYSGPPDVVELQDHLGYLTCHPAPKSSNTKVWKFETPEQPLPLLEWEIKGIYDKLVELNNERK